MNALRDDFLNLDVLEVPDHKRHAYFSLESCHEAQGVARHNALKKRSIANQQVVPWTDVPMDLHV